MKDLRKPSTSFQDEVIFVGVDEAPEFPGGEKELRNYLKNNIKFPVECIRAKVNGRVITQFVVGPDGTLYNIKVLKGLGHGGDEETIKLIKAMPKWKPGINKKKAVRTYYTIPVSFLAT